MAAVPEHYDHELEPRRVRGPHGLNHFKRHLIVGTQSCDAPLSYRRKSSCKMASLGVRNCQTNQ